MNRSAQSFRDPIVWQRAHEFVLRTYELSKQFPKEEQYLEEVSRLLVAYAKAVVRNNSKIIRTDFE